MKKIKILTTWWTLFQEEENSVRQVKNNTKSMIQKTKEILQSYANIDDIESVYNIDSSDLTHDKRNILANKIKTIETEDPNKYSWYIITHGTDTMAYTSSMLSFLIQGIKKPIVLTGSMIGLGETNSDGPNNLINSIKISIHPQLQWVLLCFGDKVVQGNKAKKEDSCDFQTFDSPKYNLIGRFEKWEGDKKLFLNEHQIERTKCILSQQSKEIFDNINAKVVTIKLTPWMDFKIFDYLVQAKIEWLVLEWYGDGNVPTNKGFQDKMKMCIDTGMVIVLKSQCHTGPAEHKYEWAQIALKSGIISWSTMTSEAAYTKLLWLLSNKNRYDVKQMLTKDVAWELL